jgi:hypothetical protein
LGGRPRRDNKGFWTSLKGGGGRMNIVITEEERDTIKHALDVYLSDLLNEIAKTDKREWKVALYEERNVLTEAIEKISVN